MQVVMFSVPVFVIIFAYFVIFILVGFIFFAGSTASESFITINESMYTVFILFTVSNYPDVQMPYFADNRLTFIYFWVFLLVGIFLLSNLLLAQIFLNYKKLVSKKLKKYDNRVQEYFLQLFHDVAEDENKTFLTVEEFTECLGGDEIVKRDKRLSDLIW